MYKSKKISVVLLILVLVTVLMLSACGGSGTSISGASTAASAEKAAQAASGVTPEKGAKITHLTLNNEAMKYLATLGPEFEKLYSGTKLEIITVPWDSFDAKLQTMAAGGTPPDVTTHYAAQSFIGYKTQDMLLDLTPILTADNFKASDYGISEKAMNDYKVDGKQYGIPFDNYVTILAYNKDIFDKAGIPYPPSDYEDKSWTWEKMIDIAKKLTKISDNPSQSQYGLFFEFGDIDVDPVYFGAKLYDDATWTNGGFPHECYFDSPEALNGYQIMEGMMFRDKVSPSPAITESLAGTGGDGFAAGKIAMSLNGAWILSGIKDYPFRLGVAAVPWYKDGKYRDTTYTDPYWIMKGSKVPNAAYLWIKYQLGKDVQERVTELSGNPPGNINAYDKYYNLFPEIDPKDMKNVVEGGLKYGMVSYGNVLAYAEQIRMIARNEWAQVQDGSRHAKDVVPVMQQKIKAKIKELNAKYSK